MPRQESRNAGLLNGKFVDTEAASNRDLSRREEEDLITDMNNGFNSFKNYSLTKFQTEGFYVDANLHEMM